MESPTTQGEESRRLWPDVGLYLLLTFGFAWLLWGFWVFAMPPGGLVLSPAFIACAIIGGFAPSLAAFAVTFYRGGMPAVRKLLATARRPVRWGYALIALAAIPAATALACGVQILMGLKLQWPDPSLLAMALVWPVMAALGEEFGWRAFLASRLVPALGLIPSALLIGIVWGVWHLPADYIGLKAYGEWFGLAFLLNGPVVLTAHSIAISMLWARTGQSTLTPLLYHWSVTFSAIVAPVASGSTGAMLLSTSVGVAAVWVAALLVLIWHRDDSRPRSLWNPREISSTIENE